MPNTKYIATIKDKNGQVYSYIDAEARDELSAITTASSGDIGKLLSPKTVSNGKVTEWQYSQMDPSSITSAVDNYLSENFTNPSNPPLDRSLLSSSSAAPADIVGQLDNEVNGSGSGERTVSSFTWVDGYGIMYNTGVPQSSESNCSYTDISLCGATHVAGYTRAGQANTRGLSFLDTYGNWIAGDYNQGAQSYDWEYSFDVPKDATVLRITCVTSRKNDFTCTLTFPNNGGIAEDVSDHDEKIVKLSNEKTGRFAHISFDDVQYCMLDITNNEETYDTIFDNPFFAFLKDMHETYGTVFSLYLFLNNAEGTTIENYTDAFANDFAASSSWLKFGLHQGANAYQNTTSTTASDDYSTFTTEITRICGNTNSIDRCPRLSNYYGNLASMQAMRDSDAGIVGLLARPTNAVSYYLTEDQSEIIYNHGRFVDTENRLTFYKTTIGAFESYDPATELQKLNTLEGVNNSSYVVVYMHEYEIYTSAHELNTSMCKRIAYVSRWVRDNGYYWNYPMNEIIQSTHGVSSEVAGVIIDDTAGNGDTDKAWSADKLVSEFVNVQNDVDDLDTQINGSAGRTQDVTSQGTWVNDHAISGNTGQINDESASYKEYQLGDAVHVAGYTRGGNDTSRGMAFYTSNGTYISGDNNYPSLTGYDWNYSFDVPENAAIFRITCAKSYQSSFTCAFTYGNVEGLVDRVETIEEQLENIDTDVDINNLESELDVKWIDGYGISNGSSVGDVNRGLYLVYSAQSIAEANVTNCAGGYIKGHTRLGDDYGIAFYDSNGMTISITKRPSGQDYEWDFTLPVPENAKKVAITCKTSSKSLFTLSCTGIADAVANACFSSALEYSCPFDVFGIDQEKSDFHYDSQTRLQDVYNWFDILASTFPRNITRVKLGDSTTPTETYATIDSNTYPIYAYVIQGDSYVSGNDFIIASGIHGDESVGDGIQSVVSVAYFIRDILCNPNKNKYLQFMKWNCKILVIPVMNPWGYQNGKRCNGRGVDVNRNFDINFDPTYTSYGYSSGTEAFSENESDAVATYIEENFATAKYCTELHTRGGNVLPADDRWFTTTTEGATDIQNAVSEVGYYMKWMFGGSVSNGQQAVATLPPTFRAYVDHVLNIPSNLIECAKSVHMDITTLNSDLVQRQYVQYLGTMTQKLVETFVM